MTVNLIKKFTLDNLILFVYNINCGESYFTLGRKISKKEIIYYGTHQ